MSSGPKLVFHSSARRGYSSAVSAHPRHVGARKLRREVQVRFADRPCTVQTQEGVVLARPGDAIITGIAGENWRVSRSHFAEKYEAVPPTVDGQPGQYRSLPISILAVPMTEAFEVVLADEASRLTGRPGDWLVDYGDGSLGIVSQPIFATTYELTG